MNCMSGSKLRAYIKTWMPGWLFDFIRPSLGAPNSLLNVARFAPRIRSPYSLGYLDLFDEETAIGPLQRDEALLLYGLVRTIRPKVILEFGFYLGHSAYNFLCAGGSGTRVFSYDVTDVSKRTATRFFSRYSNFRYIHKSQTEFDATDIQCMRVDLLFMDASHSLASNIKTFELVRPVLTDNAVIAIHDTGTWSKQHMRAVHNAFAATRRDQWLSDEEFAHQPEEREFVTYLLRQHPDFQCIHLHSANTLRHGLTILQSGKRGLREVAPLHVPPLTR